MSSKRTSRRPRGRPHGTSYPADASRLELMADLIVSTPGLSVRQAAINAGKSDHPSDIMRLQRKFRSKRHQLMLAAQQRAMPFRKSVAKRACTTTAVDHGRTKAFWPLVSARMAEMEQHAPWKQMEEMEKRLPWKQVEEMEKRLPWKQIEEMKKQLPWEIMADLQKKLAWLK